MTFITGGAYQGKTEFAKKYFGFSEKEIADGSAETPILLSAKCIRNFESFVYAVTENGANAVTAVEAILLQNPDVVIIMNEVGGGIIPIERSERKKREAVGQTGCMLAEKAETVIRLICAVPTVLKGKL